MGSIGILHRDRESVATTDSFTEEHHTMTKAELEYEPSDLEHELMEEVTKQIRDRIVSGQGSTSFGLKWECGTVDEMEFVLGGWLSQAQRSMLSSGVSNGHPRFCVMDDEKRVFEQCLDERLKVRRAIPYDEMHTVRPRCYESKSGKENENIWYIQVFGKGLRWELMPIQKYDRESILRWTAALQLRSGSYDPSISGDVSRATKAAVWTQSQHRMWKAKQRVARRREKKNALMNRLKSAIGVGGGWEDGDSDDEDDVGFLANYSNQAYEVGTNLVSNAWHAVGSWLGLGGSTTIEEEDERGAPIVDEGSRNLKRNSTFVQFSNDLPPLGPNQVEDEIWENQRWNPAQGWSCKTLGTTERCAFTDRLGRGNYGRPNESGGGMPIPANWTAVGDYQIDSSGVTKGRCDKEGYVYSLDWPLLDSDLAKGRFIIHHGAKDFVRRRRWFRRRSPSANSGSDLLNTTAPVLIQGWLGNKSPGTGRWHSRMYVLTRPGLAIGQTVTKAPSLTQFRFSFKDVEEVLKDGGVDGAKWKTLTEKSSTTIELDPRVCRVDESVADGKYPGYFAIVLDGSKKMRLFNANDAMSRQLWVAAIENALQESLKAKRPRTMRLVGGAFETTSYPTIIMDTFIMVPVDAVEEAFFQSPSVLAAVNVRQGFCNSSIDDWKNNTKMVQYTDSVTKSRITETWVRARTQPGVGFVMDRRIENPGAQFGDEFAIKCRFVLVSAEMNSEKGCRVLVSVDIEFLKQTMMVGFISSGARRDLTKSLRDFWLPAVIGYLQGKGLIKDVDMVGPSNKIQWGGSSVGSTQSSKKVMEKQNSDKIQVGKI